MFVHITVDKDNNLCNYTDTHLRLVAVIKPSRIIRFNNHTNVLCFITCVVEPRYRYKKKKKNRSEIVGFGLLNNYLKLKSDDCSQKHYLMRSSIINNYTDL